MDQSSEPEYEVVLVRVTERVVIRTASPRQFPVRYDPPVIHLPPYSGRPYPRTPTLPTRKPSGSLRPGDAWIVIWAVALAGFCLLGVKGCSDASPVTTYASR